LSFLSACGSGGGGGGGGGNNSSATQISVTGQVQAPGGQLASLSPTLFDRFFDAFIPSANANLSGLANVANGTVVNLGRIDRNGNLTVLASTTVTNGSYSFNLTQLNLVLSSDLAVQVAAGSVKMRAFVSYGTVNINPISETAFRLVMNQLSLNPSLQLSNFTVNELADLVAAIDQYTTVNGTPAGADIESTVTALSTAVSGNSALSAFLAGIAQAGETNTGPGDIGNYFPIVQGASWTYKGTDIINSSAPTAFTNVMTVSGTQNVNGVTTTVFSESNPLNTGTPDTSLLQMTNRGVYEWTDVASGTLSNPYYILQFPIRLGALFKQLDNVHLAAWGDLDGDGINEAATVNSEATVAGFENITVVAGAFSNAAKVITTAKFSGSISSNGTGYLVTITMMEWYAPGIGLVKRITQTDVQLGAGSGGETVTEELSQAAGFYLPLESGQAQIAEVPQTVNKITYDPVSNKIFASVPANAGTNGNSIAVINPDTVKVESIIPIGTEPSLLAASDDGQFLYVVMNGTAGSIKRVNIPTLTAGPEFLLGTDTSAPPPPFPPGSTIPPNLSFYAQDIAVQPGHPSVIAVSMISFANNGIVGIYDNGIRRAQMSPALFTTIDSIAFSNNPGTLYGYNTGSTESGFRTMTVDGNGVTVTNVNTTLIPAFSGKIKYDNARIYPESSGQVFNPVTQAPLGGYPFPIAANPYFVEPDSATGTTSLICENITPSRLILGHIITVFGIDSHQALGTVSFTGLDINTHEEPTDLIRWGNNGLAFVTNKNRLFLIKTSLIH
jgi:hypothetical protein